ncbi:MAG TPA: hypothetical protein VG406_05710 [Isosphaeraceae bacterium]|nr:hypothetical protein [Isosphaeraceae bacterium]
MPVAMTKTYWLVQPNGSRQLIDPGQFDLAALAEVAGRRGGRIEVEEARPAPPTPPASTPAFEPPVSALGALFRARLSRIYECKIHFELDINTRSTYRVLGGYYWRRALVRVYTHDRATGRRPLEELFDTFLHEMAHHLEYSEPESFRARSCGRVRGRMHSRLFWLILGELKGRWARLQRPPG